MSPTVIVANLLAASGQAAVVVALATAVLGILRVRAPGVTYAFWRTVAALCLVLPWVQPYRLVAGASNAVVALDAAVDAVRHSTISASSDAPVNPATIALVVIAGGALLRLAWLVVGILQLRHLRRAGTESGGHMDNDLQHTLSTRAEVRYVPSLEHPVTFGLANPVVLLPDSLRCQPADMQRAVAGHELIHVRRSDWLWLLVEEIGLSLFWFHPAAWWVASRIQLAREEVVDELTVLLTGRRKVYVEALLAFADSTSVVPTAAFARRRHLLRRIALISTEDSMSSKRIVASCAVMALVIATGAWRAVAAFPLHASNVQMTQLATGPGTLERRAHAVTPENPVPRRLHYEEMVVPDIANGVSGKIVLKITVDAAGTVAEARATGITAKGKEFAISIAGDNLAAAKMEGTASISSSDPNLVQPIRETVVALVDSAVTSVKGWRYDPPAEAPLTFGITIRFGDAPQENIFAPAPPPDDKALRVGGAIKPPVKIRDVRPAYPPDALAAGIKGVVILEARIDADGNVENARVLKSIPELDQAAIDAVKQWKFEPTLMNGVPMPVIMTVTINFTPE
jgi:TonB family protein